MTLIKSISGIRGTIGGQPGDCLTPIDAVKFASAYGSWLVSVSQTESKVKVVIGRDARVSGPMISNLIAYTLVGLGIDVIDLGLSTTPTVEMSVVTENAQGGIILTASHNPAQWNALKLLNAKGEFISAQDGKQVLDIAEKGDFKFSEFHELGKISQQPQALDQHIQAILALDLVKPELIRAMKFSIVVDGINSSGAIAVPKLLKALGVEKVTVINEEPTGHFAHNPEPLPENVHELSSTVKKNKAHLGIVVDPDVDRLAFICEDGEMFGEEYTLVAVADYILKNKPGNTVSNLSSTQALGDVTKKYNGEYHAAPVGEVNVVEKMKAHNAVIGGEGNGGIIYPELHYGRDALVGIALFLTHLAEFGKSISMLRQTYPNYYMAKMKIELPTDTDLDVIFQKLEEKYAKHPLNKEDGLKIHFDNQWVHLRKSNTEPIIRIYSESDSMATAENIAQKAIYDIKELI